MEGLIFGVGNKGVICGVGIEGLMIGGLNVGVTVLNWI
jgi:hypothetical protein